MQGVLLKRTLVLVIAGLALALVPTSAQAAVTTIPVTLTFTGAESDGAITGQVTSTKAKCVNGIDVHGENEVAHLSTSTDEQGNFTYGDEFLAGLGFENFDAYVLKGSKFGKKKRKKRCGGATGTVELASAITEIDDIEFNDVTNTFSGNLSSDLPVCENSAPLQLSHKGIGSDEYVLDRGFTSGNGTYSVAYGAEPAPGLWAVDATQFIGESSFGSENASVTYCDPGFGKAVEIFE